MTTIKYEHECYKIIHGSQAEKRKVGPPNGRSHTMIGTGLRPTVCLDSVTPYKPLEGSGLCIPGPAGHIAVTK